MYAFAEIVTAGAIASPALSPASYPVLNALATQLDRVLPSEGSGFGMITQVAVSLTDSQKVLHR